MSSFSYPGLRGAPIYRKLFRESAGHPPIHANYGVLSVGINDALAHAGSQYYARYAILLLKSIFALGIKPLLIELPRFGQQEAIEEEAWHSGIRHTINRYLFDLGKSDTIEQYRHGLKKAFRSESALLRQAILFDPDPVIGSFTRSNLLWRNPSHLSPAGDRALGTAIADIIAIDFENR